MQNVADSLLAVGSERRHQDQAQSLLHVPSHKRSPTGLEEGLNNARGSIDATVVAGQPVATIEAGAGGPVVRAGDIPKSNMMLACCSCIICFWPFGLVAVFYAARVEDMVRRGDLEGARQSAKSAQQWSLMSAVIGAGLILYMLAQY